MKTVVLLSGGIDSTVLLASCLDQVFECHAVTFDYGQRHRIREIAAAKKVAEHYLIPHEVKTLPSNLFGSSALLGDSDIPEGHADEPDATVVPGRNLVMLSCAAAIAARIGATTVLFGANDDDQAGYPDCSWSVINHIDEASYWSHGVRISAPLLTMTKRQIIDTGRQLRAPLHLTWSCYRGGQQPCRRCGACQSAQEATA